MAKRSNTAGGPQNNGLPKASSQERSYIRDQLVSLRLQLGTKELAKRLDIPVPSLRRLLSTGKSGGIPKGLLTADDKRQRIKGARRKPETRNRELAAKAAAKAWENGTLDLEYMAIARRYNMTAREVYTLGVSPEQLGQ